jgi:two-component system, NarL family, sensor kinase
LSYLLHPPLLEEIGLQAALHWFIAGIRKRSDIEATLVIQPPGLPRLTAELETAVYRVVQEAMANIVRHSESKTARVEIDRESGWITVRVRDYGVGMAHAVEPKDRSRMGVGIAGMKERIRQFGGELTVTPAGPGTLVMAKIPFLA